MCYKFNRSTIWRLRLLISISGLLFSSCARVVTEDFDWKLSNLPVVFSVLSPGKTAVVTIVGSVIPGVVADKIVYPSAEVFLSADSVHWTKLSRMSVEKAVFSDTEGRLTIAEGNSYFLRVELPDRTLTARTDISVQLSEIVKAEYVIESTTAESNNAKVGQLSAELRYGSDENCLLRALSFEIGNDNATFLNNEVITDRFSISNELQSFDLNLIVAGKELAGFLVAGSLKNRLRVTDGNLSVFLGVMYGGVLPQFSNIKNGAGMFSNYTVRTKTVTVVRQ